jgi:outer membrane biosynthesis protein TonB
MANSVLVLALCVAGSVGLHIGLLGVGAVGPVGAPGASGPQTTHRTASVQLRTVTEATPSPSPTAAPAPASHPAPEPFELNPLPPPGAGPATVHEPSASLDADRSYWPRHLLTRPPTPQQSIDLFYPDQAPSGHFRAVLTLFIDEQGVVQRVRIDEADDSGLPPVLEDAARQTFLRSRFSPGEIDGQPTRSRVRIEIEYATESLQDRRPDTPH